VSEPVADQAHRPTIKDVAALAGVSNGAVSMAFNGRPGVSDATRVRVLAAADRLGWAPSLNARALSGSRVDTISLVIARPARMLGLEPFYMTFISGIESVLADHDSGLLLRLVRDVHEEITVQQAWWRSRRVSGSILVDFRKDDPRVPAVTALGLPAVAVGHPSLTGPVPAAWTDDAAAVADAVRYLAALGHRRIVRVGGAAEFGHTAIRSAAFEEAVRELGLDQGRSIDTDFSAEQGARATRTLLAATGRPTAIVYDNDLMAVAGLSVAAEMGLSVPRDISLLAWDDSQLCELTRPRLSAMSHDVYGFGAEVARRLVAVLGGEQPASGPVATPVLTPRDSTAPPV
jgi:DNA-binding LacI/PurR family transcriptional regulator